MLTGGKTVLVPMFYENYFLATLRLLEKLHKVFTNDTRRSQLCLFGNTIQEGSVCVTVRWFSVICSLPCTVTFPGDQQVFVPCYQVNLKAQHVEYNRFYIPDITSLVDIQEDYLKWFLSKAEIVSTEFGIGFWEGICVCQVCLSLLAAHLFYKQHSGIGRNLKISSFLLLNVFLFFKCQVWSDDFSFILIFRKWDHPLHR